jgi:hypothetical protein
MIDAPSCSRRGQSLLIQRSHQANFLDDIECSLIVQISPVSVPPDAEHPLKKSNASQNTLAGNLIAVADLQPLLKRIEFVEHANLFRMLTDNF